MGVLQNSLTNLNEQVTNLKNLTQEKVTDTSAAAQQQLQDIVEALYKIIQDIVNKLNNYKLVQDSGTALSATLRDLKNAKWSLWSKEKLLQTYSLVAEALQSFIDQLKSIQLPGFVGKISSSVKNATELGLATITNILQEIHCRILNLILIAFEAVDEKLVSPVIYTMQNGVIMIRDTSSTCAGSVKTTSTNCVKLIRSSVISVAEKTKSTAIDTTIATSVFVDTKIAPDFLAGTASFVNRNMKDVAINYIENNKRLNNCIKSNLTFATQLDSKYLYGVGNSAFTVGTGVLDDVVTGYQTKKSTVQSSKPGITSKGAPVYSRAVA